MNPFSDLNALKLLDLADNQLKIVDERELPVNLVVLNLINNHCLEYGQRTLQALSRIKIVNPDDICRISCFQNFKNIALGNPSDYNGSSNFAVNQN